MNTQQKLRALGFVPCKRSELASEKPGSLLHSLFMCTVSETIWRNTKHRKTLAKGYDRWIAVSGEDYRSYKNINEAIQAEFYHKVSYQLTHPLFGGEATITLTRRVMTGGESLLYQAEAYQGARELLGRPRCQSGSMLALFIEEVFSSSEDAKTTLSVMIDYIQEVKK